ncbi:hypothetical protein C7E25_25310, partial [Stenotrophomonas maltophilia]
QIRDLLAIQERFDEHDLLAIQLDDRAVFLQRWCARGRSATCWRSRSASTNTTCWRSSSTTAPCSCSAG